MGIDRRAPLSMVPGRIAALLALIALSCLRCLSGLIRLLGAGTATFKLKIRKFNDEDRGIGWCEWRCWK
jgi:hypothetical protein